MGQETSVLTCSVIGCRFLVQSKLWNNKQQWLASGNQLRFGGCLCCPGLPTTVDLTFWDSENISEKNQAHEN